MDFFCISPFLYRIYTNADQETGKRAVASTKMDKGIYIIIR